MRKTVRFLVVLFFLVSPLYSQSVSSGLSTTPQFVIPLDLKGVTYKVGMGMNLEGMISFGDFQYLSAGLDADYLFSPLDLDGSYFSGTYLSIITLDVAVRGALPLGDRFSAYARAGAGGCIAIAQAPGDQS